MNQYFGGPDISENPYARFLDQYVNIWGTPQFKYLSLNQPVYNDINLSIEARNTGAGRPTLAPFRGNIQEFQFPVNTFSDFTPLELLHDWKEGTEIEFHLHWAMATDNDATVRGVKWQIEYIYADRASVFIAPDTQSMESSIEANEVAFKHKYTSIFSFTPATKIGTQICVQLKRIASVSNVAPVNDPFALSFGCHYVVDSFGSRQRNQK